MDKIIWSENSRDTPYTMGERGGLDAARGLIIGLAISQVFWLGLALAWIHF